MNTSRAYALDALRGYAILTMILCSAITFGILPGWMYHAQTPPPTHVFNPEVYGITWVDLVFPFFLFAMGASFPFSIGKKIDLEVNKYNIIWSNIKRGIKLTFFAIFIQHTYPWSLSQPQNEKSWGIALLAFALLFMAFTRFPSSLKSWMKHSIKWGAYSMSLVLLYYLNTTGERSFSLSYSNIIILVLANMAVFGGIIYQFTYKKPIVRIALLPFVIALLISSTTPESWCAQFYHYSPFSWIYQFHFLKYLILVLIGSFAGEFLKEWLQKKTEEKTHRYNKFNLLGIIILCFLIIAGNLYGLYTRQLVLNLIITSVLLLLLFLFLKQNRYDFKLWKHLYKMGSYLLLLGLFLEPFQGGIRKDDTTISYLFVTAGLACFALIICSIVCDIFRFKPIATPLVQTGQNPMLAYVSAQLVIMPLLNLLQLTPYLDKLNQHVWTGFLRGVIVTFICLLFTILFSRKKLFWRT
jgi:predicted acyltransferase